MDKNSMPPETKPTSPESSEEGSRSSEEETEDEEQAEGGSGFESGSGSDESTDATKKKLISILPMKQQSAGKGAAPAAAPGSPAKRTREANGKRDTKEDEPPSKKKKPEVAIPAPKAAPKQSEKRSATKTEKGKSTPPAREKQSKDLPAEKDTKKSAKKKTQNPAAAKPTTSNNKSEDETPQKPKNFSRPWSPDEELALSRELQKDRVNDVYGSTLPAARADPYWEKLMSRFPFMDKYEKEQRIERLCEKVRRMRLRYESLNTRLKAGETSVYKNPHEGVLWRIWHTIWGPNKATPSMLNGDDDDEEEEEEEEDGSDDEGSEEEDEEEEVVPTQAKGRPSMAGRATAQKKAPSKKAAGSSSEDDDESNKEEDTPVKATPPAVAAKGQGASKAVPAKGHTPTAMDVDVNNSGKNNTSRRAAVHNGALVVEKSVRADALPKVTDELRAENLALLRDMRGTCVKMVEEAKTQSLALSEKMLEETRVKATQIVEEAKVKSAQIMDELRLVVERLGSVAAGQSGQRMNGSHVGRWNDLAENPFQGTGLLVGNGALPLGDLNSLDDKWREQSEAEQGLLLQRLQLVQEQARIQQEGIRLKLNLQKQQALAHEQA